MCILFIFLSLAISVSARVLDVPNQYARIQWAINDANNGDMVIVAPGTYQENIDFLGKAITLISTDPNDPNITASTIINGSQTNDVNIGSVVTFRSGEGTNSVLCGFTITGGTGTWLAVSWEYKGLRWNRCGGGVVCYNMSAPTIRNNYFIGNIAGQGGGIYIYGDPGSNPNDPINPSVHITPLVVDNTFLNNSAIVNHGFEPPNQDYPNNDHGDGGAIVGFQGVDAVITGNLIQENDADFYGGGIHLRQWSNGAIEDNVVIGNNSMLGAGIHITYSSDPLVRSNLVSRNTAGAGGGGGIYVYGYSSPVIERNIVAENVCVNGAGIAVYFSSTGVIRNNFIVKNISGAGIRVRGHCSPHIIHNTIADNSANSSSGGIDLTENSSPTIENNIVAYNSPGYGIYCDQLSVPVLRYNNIYNSDSANYCPNLTDQTGINGNISAPASFVDRDANNYHLRQNSACINSGDLNFIDPGAADYDQQPRKMGQFTDIGADEVYPVSNITSQNYYMTIQQALNDANDMDTIVVSPDLYYERIVWPNRNLVLRSSDPNDWSIVGKTIIDANFQGRAVTIENHIDANSTFAGFTITHGTASHGGGILCYGSPLIRRNIITANISPNYKGGGAYFWGSSAKAVLSDNFFHDNQAVFGGAIFCDTNSRVAILANSIISNIANTGAAIRCQMNYPDEATKICNNTIMNNRANDSGGAVSCANTNIQIANNLIAGNKAPSGAGVEAALTEVSVINNTIISNSDGICSYELTGLIANNIIAYNADIGLYIVPDPCYSSGFQINNNDVWNNTGGNYGGDLTDQTGQNSNISTNPQIADPGYWDDFNTPDDANDDVFVAGNYHLTPGSPCADAGDNNSVIMCPDTDLDGQARIFNNVVDIGADELVTNSVDFNSDGIVDLTDLYIVITDWLVTGESDADLFEDGFVDFLDYCVLAHQWLWTGGWYQ
ncbi:MAG: right-handed parallel beta-helix repeat-containing protein [Planctomycetota bacterium]